MQYNLHFEANSLILYCLCNLMNICNVYSIRICCCSVKGQIYVRGEGKKEMEHCKSL